MTTPDEPVLQIYDTLTATKRPLELREPGRCGIYCCGPTVYDLSHIGHARAALVPDVLVRFLRSQGLAVTYVRNVTDIDDKIIKRASESGADSAEIAERFTEAYRHDLAAMGLLAPDVEPRVTEHIAEVITMIEALQAKGLAYAAEGDVYFEVAKFPGYGKLSKRDLSEMRAGARVEVDTRKRAPADFALWKAAKPGEPAWDSPWGRGRPGWHIECSAMSTKHLGVTFDIHSGGQDLVFPHHENEIAQSQGTHGDGTYARYWMHNGFVNFAGEKMSKSLGNFFTIREVTTLYHPEVLRYFLLQVHYRRGVNFDVQVLCPACHEPMSAEAQQALCCEHCGHATTDEGLRTQVKFPGLEETDDRVAYVYETLQAAREIAANVPSGEDTGEVPEPVAGMLHRFTSAMRDDLNTAAALAELSEPLAAVNRLLASTKGVSRSERTRILVRFCRDFAQVATVLGTFERDPTAYLQERRDLKARRLHLDVEYVESLVRARIEARQSKDWDSADAVRDELTALGVKIRDVGSQTVWTL